MQDRAEEVTQIIPTAPLAKEMETISFSNRPTVRLRPEWASPVVEALLREGEKK